MACHKHHRARTQQLLLQEGKGEVGRESGREQLVGKEDTVHCGAAEQSTADLAVSSAGGPSPRPSATQ